MGSETLQLLLNASAGVAVAFGAFYYFDKMTKTFTHTINDYLKESVKVKQDLAKQLERFSIASQENTEVIEKQTDIIKKMYSELYKKHQKIRDLERR